MARRRSGKKPLPPPSAPPQERHPGSPGACRLCLDDEPNARYLHLLDLARDHSFEAIELHLWAAFREGTTLDVERMRGYVADRMYWIRDQVTSYSGMVDHETGAALPWWQARQQAIAAFHAARGPAPARHVTRAPVYGASPPAEEEAWEECHTYARREPGEEEGEDA